MKFCSFPPEPKSRNLGTIIINGGKGVVAISLFLFAAVMGNGSETKNFARNFLYFAKKGKRSSPRAHI
jgi:hypothetical protein